jgi:hypothetical protein
MLPPDKWKIWFVLTDHSELAFVTPDTGSGISKTIGFLTFWRAFVSRIPHPIPEKMLFL